MANAQEEMPQITPGERKAPRKKDAGPRAVGVLQLAANGKASLVPIAILVDGKFWDATAYKADPIPMALEPGTVYEAERAGNSLGLFTVNSALHSNAVNVQSPWLGTGSWVPEGSEKPKTALTAEKAPIGIETTDEPPRLTRRESPPQPSAPTPAPASAPPNTAGGSASPGKTSSKTESNPSSPAPSSSPPAPAGNPKSGDAKPARRQTSKRPFRSRLLTAGPTKRAGRDYAAGSRSRRSPTRMFPATASRGQRPHPRPPRKTELPPPPTKL